MEKMRNIQNKLIRSAQAWALKKGFDAEQAQELRRKLEYLLDINRTRDFASKDALMPFSYSTRLENLWYKTGFWLGRYQHSGRIQHNVDLRQCCRFEPGS